MNNEIKITIIACVVIFVGIGFLAFDTMNSAKMIKPNIDIIHNQPAKNLTDDSKKPLSDFPNTVKVKLDDELDLEKTIVLLNIPEDNTHPWGFIKGIVNNHAPGYPVIIQFFKSLESDPIHVAQVDLKDDGSYEYKFRVLSIDEGITTHYFEGEYYIKLFQTVTADR